MLTEMCDECCLLAVAPGDCVEEHVTTYRQCRNLDFTWNEQCPVFYPYLKSCVFDPESSGGICESADDPVRILERLRVRIRSFRKNI